MKIYTKTGDKGTTSLIGGDRVPKDDPRVNAYGTVDELTAFIAYLRDNMDGEQDNLELYRNDLLNVLEALMTVAALFATTSEAAKKVPPLQPERIAFLEKRIDEISAGLPPLTHFTIPGGHPLVSLAHICRTICRRAERMAISVGYDPALCGDAQIYLNRLSDYLYVLGRGLGMEFNAKEVYWMPER